MWTDEKYVKIFVFCNLTGKHKVINKNEGK